MALLLCMYVDNELNRYSNKKIQLEIHLHAVQKLKSEIDSDQGGYDDDCVFLLTEVNLGQQFFISNSN